VFLDRTSLAANPDAWGTVERILDDTRTFVLLASPQAAESEWVDREFAHFRAHHPDRKLAVVLTDGTLRWDAEARHFESDALPRSAREAFDEEPLWVDLTWTRGAPRWKLTLFLNPRFRDNVASLAAYVRGSEKEMILDEDGRQRRRGILAGLVVVGALAGLAFALVSALGGRSHEQALAVSRQLAIESGKVAAPQGDLALLLAVYADQTSGTVQARSALVRAVSGAGHLARYLHPGGPVTDVAVDPRGRSIALGRYDGDIELWNVETGSRTDILQRAGPGPAHVAVGPDGLVVGGWGDGTVARWNPLASVWQRPRKMGAAVDRLAAARDGRTIAVGLSDGRVVVLDAATGAERATFRIVSDPVTALAFDPSGTIIAIGMQDGTIGVRPVATSHVRLGPKRRAAVRSLAFDERGRRLALGRDDGTAAVWNLGTNAVVRLPSDHGQDAIEGVTFLDGDTLVTSAAQGAIEAWDLRESGHQRPASLGQAPAEIFTATPDGRLAVTAAAARAREWSFGAAPTLTRPLASLDGMVSALAFDPRSDMLAAATPGGPIRIVDARTGRPRRVLPGAQRDVLGLAFGADGTTLFSVGSDRRILRWRLGDPEPAVVQKVSSAGIGAASLGSGSAPVAYLDATGAVRVGTRRHPVARVDPTSSAVAVNAQGHVAVGDGTLIRIRSPGAGTLQFPGFSGEGVTSLAYQANGSMLAAGGADHQVAVWDLRDPSAPLVSGVFFSDFVTALALSPDGSELAVGTSDGRITLFAMDPAAWESVACRLANRDLTEQERRDYLRSPADSKPGCRHAG
jgi:WD40 repeat protein